MRFVVGSNFGLQKPFPLCLVGWLVRLAIGRQIA